MARFPLLAGVLVLLALLGAALLVWLGTSSEPPWSARVPDGAAAPGRHGNPAAIDPDAAAEAPRSPVAAPASASTRDDAMLLRVVAEATGEPVPGAEVHYLDDGGPGSIRRPSSRSRAGWGSTSPRTPWTRPSRPRGSERSEPRSRRA